MIKETGLPQGTEIEGRYRIERLLASGGMSTIYQAYDHHLQRMVAIKLLKPQIGRMPELAERFINEARALAKLRNRHVIRVLDYGRIRHITSPSTPYIVMELLEGGNLGDEIAKMTTLSTTIAANYILETCEGLAEAHALGIVHRDIKPENVFLALEQDGTTTVKLVDFGISKSSPQVGNHPVTPRSECLGSPQYMSPEQMRALPVDARSDIWAIGTVLYECVTGEFAFLGTTVFEVAAQVLEASLPDLRSRNPSIPEAFVCIVERCLKRDPAQRYQTVQELARELEPLAVPHRLSSAERIARTLGIEPKATESTGANEGSSVITLKVNPSVSARRVRMSRARQKTYALFLVALIFSYVGFRYPKNVFRFFAEARQKTTFMYESILP